MRYDLAMTRYVALGVLAAGCAHAAPSVTGAQLYANVASLQTTGAADIGSVHVVASSVLTTGSDGPAYVVKQVVEHCKGGDPTADVDCTLALLLDQRFQVRDRAPERRSAAAKQDDRSGSMLSSVAVITLAVAATGGLIYGGATCDFPGCKVVFGGPLLLLGGAALFTLGRD